MRWCGVLTGAVVRALGLRDTGGGHHLGVCGALKVTGGPSQAGKGPPEVGKRPSESLVSDRQIRCIEPSEAPVWGSQNRRSRPLRGTGVGPLEVAVEALAGAVVRALRNTGVGRGAIANVYGPLQLIPYWPARALRAGKVPQNLA